MTAIEETRFRLLHSRRAARRMLKQLGCLERLEDLSPAEHADVTRNVAFGRMVLAVTKPAWIAKASADELIGALEHISGRQN